MGVIPARQNGTKDWAAYVRTTWPVLVAIVGAALWVQGRMETPEIKENRIRLVCGEMIRLQVPPREVRDTLRRLENKIDENHRLIMGLISGQGE